MDYGVNSVLVEGGPTLQSSFVRANQMDEYEYVSSDTIGHGVPAIEINPNSTLILGSGQYNKSIEMAIFYLTQPCVANIKEKGSVFKAYLLPVQSTESFFKQLGFIKEQEPRANHHCWAYRIDPDGPIRTIF